MTLQYTLFTDVSQFYAQLTTAVARAQHSIHLIYFAFDNGRWASQLSDLLQEKAQAGLDVHLMVDEVGLYVDNPRHGWQNQRMLNDLSQTGVRVVRFRPNGRRLSQRNRLHCKACAIDDHVAFIGGSNIGDHYPHWRDSNLRLMGAVGDTFRQLYDYLCQFTRGEIQSSLPFSNFCVDDVPVLMTVPGHRQDIRRALLDLILNAETAVYLRTWYFLPDQEILNALMSQAESGVNVTILFSHQTRVPLIDAANRLLGHQLTRSGVQIYRYTSRYMHAKEAWNDRGEIIFGSANVDRWALTSNFECSLRIQDSRLMNQLQQALLADLVDCRAVGAQRPLPSRPSLI